MYDLLAIVKIHLLELAFCLMLLLFRCCSLSTLRAYVHHDQEIEQVQEPPALLILHWERTNKRFTGESLT